MINVFQYIKQLKKLEADLKEIEAQESFRKRDKFVSHCRIFNNMLSSIVA